MEPYNPLEPGSLDASFLVRCLLAGQWVEPTHTRVIPDPLTGDGLFSIDQVTAEGFESFRASLRRCPSFGLHNPLHNVGRYRMLGDVCAKVAALMRDPKVEDSLIRLVMRCMPKSYLQAKGEVVVTRTFFENFGGDQVRFLAQGFSVSGDHQGQESRGYRWPFGPVVIICPFNFPLEIPALQLMGALFMGNKPLLKVDSKVAVVMAEFLRLLHACGLPPEDVDMLCCNGSVMGEFLELCKADIRLVQFTGSSATAEEVSRIMNGRVRLEDAGYDWKILGPDEDPDFITRSMPFVAVQCDQDAYAASGQKCSAQSIMFMHQDWEDQGLTSRLARLAASRKLEDLTVGPVLTWTTERMLDHVQCLLEIPGAELLFGGKPLEGHTIPACYGALQPTAVQVPIQALSGESLFGLVTTEVFGPVQVVVPYTTDQLPLVLAACERMGNRLTAAVVSRDPVFLNRVLGATTNGTTYAGIRARTTGAPQNHWFGPASDPRAAGIGSPGAILGTWSCHREIIMDQGPLPDSIPAQS